MLYLASYIVKSIFLTSSSKFYAETMQYRATTLIFQNLVITSKSFSCIHVDSALCTSQSNPNIVQEPMYHLAITRHLQLPYSIHGGLIPGSQWMPHSEES